MRGGRKPRQRPGGRSRNGLASTLGPLVAGVLLAFGWNMLLSPPHGAAGVEGSEPGITRQVGRTAEEVTAKAWASATPRAAPRAAPDDDGAPAGGGRAPVSSREIDH